MVRGSARCTGSSGLGDTAAFIPAGGGPVREVKGTSRTVRCALWPMWCAQVWPSTADLAEYRRCRTASPMPPSGPRGVQLPLKRGAFGGARAARSPLPQASFVAAWGLCSCDFL